MEFGIRRFVHIVSGPGVEAVGFDGSASEVVGGVSVEVVALAHLESAVGL